MAAVDETGIPSYVKTLAPKRLDVLQAERVDRILVRGRGGEGMLAPGVRQRCHEGELPRSCPVLYPGHPHTSELAVFERAAEIAWERSWAGDLLVSPTNTDSRPGTTFTTGVQEADRSMRSSYPHTR